MPIGTTCKHDGCCDFIPTRSWQVYCPRCNCQGKAASQRMYHRRYKERRDYIRAYKTERSCADCGENDPIVLQFDHVSGEKSFTIGSSISMYGMYPDYMLQEEIEKCDVVCANCHTRRTHLRKIESADRNS